MSRLHLLTIGQVVVEIEHFSNVLNNYAKQSLSSEVISTLQNPLNRFDSGQIMGTFLSLPSFVRPTTS
jgi:hypothetical protein